MKVKLPQEQVKRIIKAALEEDLSQGDITTEALISPKQLGEAHILSRSEGVLAGIEVARMVFHELDPSLHFEVLKKDGERIKPGDRIATITGSVSSILKAERVALNFLQRLSGIASEVARYVAEVEGLKVSIFDTRKTTPGLRILEKYAVRVGGGRNHRFHLGDGILIKDNHLAALRVLGMSLKDIVAKAKREAPRSLEVEVEVSSAKEALEAAEAGASIIMLDNMSPDEMKRAVEILPREVKLEASGGINLENVRAIAETGVDRISIGAITHSARALDISLELEPQILKLL